MKHGKLVALGVLWAAVTFGMAAMPGCYGRNCEGTQGTWGNEPGQGRMIDENTWESNPMDGDWLHFSSGRVWFFDVPALGNRTPYSIETYLSPVESPNNRTPSNLTMGAGNLAELSSVGPNRFVVRNGSCAEYWMRVVVEVPPAPEGELPVPDASVAPADAGDDSGAADGGDDDGGAGDAGTDAEAGS